MIFALFGVLVQTWLCSSVNSCAFVAQRGPFEPHFQSSSVQKSFKYNLVLSFLFVR